MLVEIEVRYAFNGPIIYHEYEEVDSMDVIRESLQERYPDALMTVSKCKRIHCTPLPYAQLQDFNESNEGLSSM